MSSKTPLKKLRKVAATFGALGAVTATVLPLVACGKKAPPLPPLRAVPQAARDLAALQRGSDLLLEFAYPATTAAGTTLGELEAVEVLAFARPVAPEGALAPTAPITPREFLAGAGEAVRVSGTELLSAIDGDRVRVRLPLPAVATSYAVRSVAARGAESDLSNVIAVTPAAAPSPPQAFGVTGAQEGVRLTWQVAPGAAGINIYRRDATRRSYGKPLATAAADQTSYLDASAQFGRRYVYTVTAAAAPGGSTAIESALAGEQEIHHEDRFPPVAPSRVVALADRGRVRVVWEASASPDVVGYVVTRQTASEPPSRVTPEPVTQLEATDTTVAPGSTYLYRVAALDAAGNLGEPSAPAEARTP
jgi:hypothetical protein